MFLVLLLCSNLKSRTVSYNFGLKIVLTFLVIFIFLRCIYLFLVVLGLHSCVQASLFVASRGYSLLWCADFPLQWLLLWQDAGCRHMGCSSCSAGAQWLWLTGSRTVAEVRGAQLLCSIWEFPRPGIKPDWQAESQPQDHQGRPL